MVLFIMVYHLLFCFDRKLFRIENQSRLDEMLPDAVGQGNAANQD